MDEADDGAEAARDLEDRLDPRHEIVRGADRGGRARGESRLVHGFIGGLVGAGAEPLQGSSRDFRYGPTSPLPRGVEREITPPLSSFIPSGRLRESCSRRMDRPRPRA